MPIFEMKNEHYYHGLWRANFSHGDILAMMWLDAGIWYFRYRFRYFVDEKVWNSDDKRSAYEVKMPDGPDAKEKMFEAIHKLFDVLTNAGAITNLAYFPCGGNGEAMAKVLISGIEGIHHKHMTNEQFEEYQRTNKMPEGV